VREIRLHGSEGGGTEINRFFLPLSKTPVARIRWRTPAFRLFQGSFYASMHL
jgi:hypothetical protein